MDVELFTTHNVALLSDESGGHTWWCGRCGARGMGRLLNAIGGKRRAIDEATRLAHGHLRRCPKRPR